MFLVASMQPTDKSQEEIDVTITSGHSKFLPRKTVISVFPDSGASVCLAGKGHMKQLNVSEIELIPCLKKIQVAVGNRLTVLLWIPSQVNIKGKASTQPLFRRWGQPFLFEKRCLHYCRYSTVSLPEAVQVTPIRRGFAARPIPCDPHAGTGIRCLCWGFCHEANPH